MLNSIVENLGVDSNRNIFDNNVDSNDKIDKVTSHQVSPSNSPLIKFKKETGNQEVINDLQNFTGKSNPKLSAPQLFLGDRENSIVRPILKKSLKESNKDSLRAELKKKDLLQEDDPQNLNLSSENTSQVQEEYNDDNNKLMGFDAKTNLALPILDTEESITDDHKTDLLDSGSQNIKKNLFSLSMPTHVKYFLIISAIYFLTQVAISLLCLLINVFFVVRLINYYYVIIML